MLKELLALRECTMSITTSDSGQATLAVFSPTKHPLAITLDANNIHLAEREVIEYAVAVAGITTTSNKDDAIQKTQQASDKSKPNEQKAAKSEESTPSQSSTQRTTQDDDDLDFDISAFGG
ncbi:hypothetical protein ACPV5U_19585 [Vibrio mediterranei]